MPEPITPEQLLPQRLTIGETPVFFTSPLEINGQQVTQLTLQGERARGKDGVQSAVLLIKEQSRRRGEEGVAFSKPLMNVNAMEEVDWDKVEGLQFTSPDGAIHTIPKEQLSLTKPEETPRPLETLATPAPPPEAPTLPQQPTTREPKLARSILEKYSGAPATLTIVGLKAYETRAHDLADKSMQVKPGVPKRQEYEGAKEAWEKTKDVFRGLDNLGENIWKHGIGPVYFQEKARQYYLDMLKASNSPFADSSIKIAEAAGKNRYQELLDNKNFLTRGSRRFIEWVKSSLGARTLAQQFALEEIAHMRETGEIKETESFEREGASIRKRFEMDFNAQDDVIRKTLGEKLDILDPANAQHKPLVEDIRGLVRRYATGQIATKEDFDKASDELFQTHLKGSRPDIFHEAELYSSSLYEVAESMRTKASHEGGLAAIDAQLENMQVRLGMGVMGEATALAPTDVKRGTDMVQSILTNLEKKGIVGPFLLNEATVSSGVALALTLVILPKTAISSISRIPGGFIGFAGGAAVGAVFGGLREYRMLEREYLTHLREREAGLTFSPDAKRRAWMERFFVGQRTADDLITGIRGTIYEPDGTTLRASLSEDDIRLSLANLADAKARKALSARQHERNAQRVGLIQFSGRENIETQRTALDLTIAQAEKDLAPYFDKFPTLADLTAAQTRILSEGVNRVAGLSDPMRVTLNLLDKYNPEVEIMRRRFPLLGPEGKTGKKAQGLDDILKEFRTAARGAAIKKGLTVGLSGALIGLGIREGLQLGSEVLSKLSEVPHGLLPPADINPGQNFAFSNNLQMHGADLVDKNNAVIVPGLQKYLANSANKAIENGELSNTAKQWIIDQAKLTGHTLDIPHADSVSVSFSNDHLANHLGNFPNGESISAPPQLHWMDTAAGRNLVVDGSFNGSPAQQILYSDALKGPRMTDAALAALKHNGIFNVIDAKTLTTVLSPDHGSLAGIPQLIDAQGGTHAIEATFPKGTELISIGHAGNDHIFKLVDVNDANHVLLDKIHINDLGKITNLDALNKVDQTIRLANSHGETITMVEKGGVGGLFDKPVAEMGAEKGASGPWGWLEDPINADHTVSHALPGTNLAKNLFRGYQENYLPAPEHANYTSLNPGDVYHNLPKALFEDSQLVKLGHIMDEAIKMKEVDGTKLADMDELHRAAYEIGRVGRVATKDEIQTFLDAMGGGEKSVTLFTPVITRTLISDIPASITGNDGSVVTNIITLAERAPVGEFNWVPPIPILWRRPLEPYEALAPFEPTLPGILPPPEPERPTPYLFAPGYGPYSTEWGNKYSRDEILAHYKARRHPNLNEDPKAKLSLDEATQWYFKQQSPEYMDTLSKLNQTIGVPMSESAAVAVCIPVAGHQEANNIYRTLTNYAKQTDLEGKPLDPSTYEVILFVNAPVGESVEGTMQEIKRFQKDYSSVPVRVATGAFQKGTVRYGAYIKYAYDLALLRARERQAVGGHDIAIATMDADTVHIDPTYLAANIRFLEDPKNARFDATLGMQDFDHKVLAAYPTFMAALRFGQYMDVQGRRGIPGWDKPERDGEYFPNIITQGRTSFIRASTLAAVGGVNSSTPAGADKEIGEMITLVRTGKEHSIPEEEHPLAYNNEAGIETNPRRELVTMLSGKLLTQTWEKFDEGENVRKKSIEELIRQSPEKPGELNIPELERQVNGYRQWGVVMNSYNAKRALSWLGMKEGEDYIIEQDDKGPKLKITSDLFKLREELRKFSAKTLETADHIDPSPIVPERSSVISSPVLTESASVATPAEPSSTQPPPTSQS